MRSRAAAAHVRVFDELENWCRVRRKHEPPSSNLGADPELHIPRRRAARAFRRKRAKILDGNCKSGTTHIEPRQGAPVRQYVTNHQVALGRFLDYGFVPPDNGIVERLHVRAALTRKNFLFAGADSGGERAAIAYTILGSCRLAGVDPLEYLADVLPKLTRRIRLLDLPSLLPSRWAAARAATSAT